MKKSNRKQIAKQQEKQRILNGIKQAITEINQIKAGKKKAVALNDFLKEL